MSTTIVELMLTAAGVAVGYLIGTQVFRKKTGAAAVGRAVLAVVFGVAGMFGAGLLADGGADGAGEGGGRPLEVITSAERFDQLVLQADKPVLVDFYADWCPPCKRLAPILERVNADWHAKAGLYKVNGDKNPELKDRYGVQAYPTMVVFVDGEPAERIVGLQSRQHIEQVLQEVSQDAGA